MGTLTRALFILVLFTSGSILAKSPAKHVARLSVRNELKKEKDTRKTGSGKNAAKTKTEVQHYELDIRVINPTDAADAYTVEWYFLKWVFEKNGHKSDAVVSDKGHVVVRIESRKQLNHSITSKDLTWTDSVSSKGRKISGDYYAGYIVLVCRNGDIIAKDSNDRKYLSEQWISLLNRG